MDWMTLSIEIIGFVILCIWVVVPIQEFGTIYRTMKKERSGRDTSAGESQSAKSLD